MKQDTIKERDDGMEKYRMRPIKLGNVMLDTGEEKRREKLEKRMIENG